MRTKRSPFELTISQAIRLKEINKLPLIKRIVCKLDLKYGAGITCTGCEWCHKSTWQYIKDVLRQQV